MICGRWLTRGADRQAERRHGWRGLWLAPTFEGMVALQGLLEAEAGHTLLAALDPLARPHNAQDDRSGDQSRADALTELARRALEAGQLPQTGGVRPQLTVTVDLDSLLGHPSGHHGHQPGGHRDGHDDLAATRTPAATTTTTTTPAASPGDTPVARSLADRLHAAMALLPPILGGAPQPAAGGGVGQPGHPPRPNPAPWPWVTGAGCSPPASGPGLVPGPSSGPRLNQPTAPAA